MPLFNRIVVAAAGSGKTTTIVEHACADDAKRTAVITYTNNGRDEIVARTYRHFGCIPPHIRISTWYVFLLKHFVRPYQRCMHQERIGSIRFVEGRSAQYVPAANIDRHYFSKSGWIFSDKVSKFACEVIQRSGDRSLQRFSQIFSRLYIDESQDLSGYDLDLIEALLKTEIEILLVGDHRQATYSTNKSPKNKKFAGSKIVDKFKEWEKAGLCTVEYQNFSHRCIQPICDFADQFHPDAPSTESKNDTVTGHDGVFAVRISDVIAYIARFNPQVLRYSAASKNLPGKPINFGNSKGMTFERTLIFPHGKLKKFLKTGRLADAGKELSKIYVALTRARQSVALVVEDNFKPCLSA